MTDKTLDDAVWHDCWKWVAKQGSIEFRENMPAGRTFLHEVFDFVMKHRQVAFEKGKTAGREELFKELKFNKNQLVSRQGDIIEEQQKDIATLEAENDLGRKCNENLQTERKQLADEIEDLHGSKEFCAKNRTRQEKDKPCRWCVIIAKLRE